VPSLRALALLLVVACAVAGCGFRLGYDDGRADVGDGSAGDDGAGPDAAGPDAAGDDGAGDDGAGPDAGPPPGEPGIAGCGALQLLRDDFADGERDFLWNLFTSGAELLEVNGRMEARFAAGSADDSATLESGFRYDLRNSELSAEIQRVGGRLAQLRVRDVTGRGIGLGVEAGNLKALRRDGGIDQTLALVPYASDSHRFWRLREQDGETLWEASGDRQRWQEIHRDQTFFDPTAVYALIEARGRVAAASELWFDSVNTTAPISPGYCPASAVRDDFDGSAVDPFWIPFTAQGECTAAQAGGRAELTFRGSGFALCAFTSSRQVSLRDSSFSFEIASAPSSAPIETVAGLFQSRGTGIFSNQTSQVEVRIISGVAHMKTVVDGATTFDVTLPFDAARHRFWRIRHASAEDEIHWETSADGSAWTVRAMQPIQVDIDDLFVSLSGQQNPPGSSASQVVRFDNVNLP
jgi:hypothetical protein